MDDGTIKWHVLGDQIHQTTSLAPSGSGIVDVWEVPYMIDSGPASGHQGQVQIPATRYSPDEVKRAITVAVGNTHDVASLKN